MQHAPEVAPTFVPQYYPMRLQNTLSGPAAWMPVPQPPAGYQDFSRQLPQLRMSASAPSGFKSRPNRARGPCFRMLKNGYCNVPNCTFYHVDPRKVNEERSDNRPPCVSFLKRGFCNNAKCTYRHVETSKSGVAEPRIDVNGLVPAHEPKDNERKLCYDFANKGVCKYGAHCRYTHIQRVCYEFVNKGTCSREARGEKCKYLHTQDQKFQLCPEFLRTGACSRMNKGCRFKHEKRNSQRKKEEMKDSRIGVEIAKSAPSPVDDLSSLPVLNLIPLQSVSSQTTPLTAPTPPAIVDVPSVELPVARPQMTYASSAPLRLDTAHSAPVQAQPMQSQPLHAQPVHSQPLIIQPTSSSQSFVYAAPTSVPYFYKCDPSCVPMIPMCPPDVSAATSTTSLTTEQAYGMNLCKDDTPSVMSISAEPISGPMPSPSASSVSSTHLVVPTIPEMTTSYSQPAQADAVAPRAHLPSKSKKSTDCLRPTNMSARSLPCMSNESGFRKSHNAEKPKYAMSKSSGEAENSCLRRREIESFSFEMDSGSESGFVSCSEQDSDVIFTDFSLTACS